MHLPSYQSLQGTRPYNLGEEPEASALAAAEALGLMEPHSPSSPSSSANGGPQPPHRARLFSAAEDMVGADLVLVMDKYTAGDVMREVGLGGVGLGVAGLGVG